MKIFKFGGASVNSVERIQNLASLLTTYTGQPLVVVISAMGKTTNELEQVVHAFYNKEQEQALSLFDAIKQKHLAIYAELLQDDGGKEALLDLFTEVEWLLHDRPVREFDYYYDQIVCIGELLSTTIISAYLNHSEVPNTWIDVRDILRTDDTYRDAHVDYDYTRERIESQMRPLLNNNSMLITQGFIGCTAENESTTLGREGSDYTAAIFANLLNAASLTIWKDVEGVMNADPKVFSHAEIIRELNYKEVIEMAYYGAQVIHPKTIKPLQNKHIPLYVKCFLDKNLPGTIIHDQPVRDLPAIIVLKQNQLLLHLNSKDFSFVGEKSVSNLYNMLANLNIQPNLIQSGAISLLLCLDDKGEKTEKLALEASLFFDVQVEKGLTLLTIRHYTEDVLATLTNNQVKVLQQQTPDIVQVLMK